VGFEWALSGIKVGFEWALSGIKEICWLALNERLKGGYVWELLIVAESGLL